MIIRQRIKDKKTSSEVVEICNICYKTFNSPEDNKPLFYKEHSDNNEIEIIFEEEITVSNEYKTGEFPEKKEEIASYVWVEEDFAGFQGMTIKGEVAAFKYACPALRTELVKGRLFKDSQGRELTILEVPKGKKPIDVEVTTMNNNPNEKIGKAKIHIWQPTKKKPFTIMVTMFSGSKYVFVKTVMEKFVKPFIDALISEPDEDPLSQYRVKVHNKSVINENVNLKVENELNEKCDQCNQMCRGKHGLGIHYSKMHVV